jgi:hypothetical protein
MSVNIGERFQEMSLGEKIILIAAPLFFIASFLPWFNYDLGIAGDVSKSGWSGDGAIFSILAVLLALVMLAQIIIARFTTVQLPALPQGLTWPRIHLGAGVIILLLVALRFLLGESTGGFDADRSYGLFIAIILAIALAAGGFLMFQEEQKAGGGDVRGNIGGDRM